MVQPPPRTRRALHRPRPAAVCSHHALGAGQGSHGGAGGRHLAAAGKEEEEEARVRELVRDCITMLETSTYGGTLCGEGCAACEVAALSARPGWRHSEEAGVADGCAPLAGLLGPGGNTGGRMLVEKYAPVAQDAEVALGASDAVKAELGVAMRGIAPCWSLCWPLLGGPGAATLRWRAAAEQLGVAAPLRGQRLRWVSWPSLLPCCKQCASRRPGGGD